MTGAESGGHQDPDQVSQGVTGTEQLEPSPAISHHAPQEETGIGAEPGYEPRHPKGVS